MSRDITLEDVTLAGRHVALRPMRAADIGDLAAIALAGDLLRWFPHPPRAIQDVEAFVGAALAARAAGDVLPFVTTDAATGAVIGTTRFANIDRANRHVEIGWTFLAPAHQRSGANVEAKRLMLAHAFEAWGCGRVEFKTDSNNVASRRSLAALGAVEEGTFRNHMLRGDGSWRHSVWFSILDSEWPAVRDRLDTRLAAVTA